MTNDTNFRLAATSDARALAMLIDIAGEGLPSSIWRQSSAEDQDPIDIGMERARRETGGFSYRNAVVAEVVDGNVVGMLLGYPIEVAPKDGPEDVPPAFAPFLDLEAKSVGTWYVNALAVMPGYQGRGIGSSLMAEAERQAAASQVARLSIQVFAQNTSAYTLYRRLGYIETARSPVRTFPCQPYYTGDVVLLEKDV